MSIDRLLDRHSTEGQNKVSGWLPGIVMDLNDPKKLGRVKVKCPLIDNDNPLPNNEDGWVQLLNRSSGAGSPGGTNELIQVGDQIVLLSMMGDVRQCIGIGVLHSFQDPPSPHFDRPNGVYGSHSKNGDLEIKDEQNRRSIRTLNGNTEIIDERGRTIESPEGAKVVVGARGNIHLENKTGTIGLSPAGDITINNGKASLGFDPQGEVTISNKNTPAIKFTEFGTYISGQKDRIARNLELVSSLSKATFSQLPVFSSRLESLADYLTNDLDYAERLEVIYQIDLLFETIIPGLQKIAEAASPLQELADSDAVDIGIKVVGQIDTFKAHGLDKIAKKYQAGISEEQIVRLEREMFDLLSEEALNKIDFAQLSDRLRGLQHDPNAQLRAILESVVPFGQIDAVIGNQLHKNIARLETFKRSIDELGIEPILDKIDSFGEVSTSELSSTINSISGLSSLAPPIDPGASKIMVVNVKKVTQKIRATLAGLKSKLDLARGALDKINQLRTNIDLEREFGNLVLLEIKKLSGCIELISKDIEAAIFIEALTTALLLDDPDNIINALPKLNIEYDPEIIAPDRSLEIIITEVSRSILPKAIASFLNSISPQAKLGLTAISTLTAIASANTTGGGLDLTPTGLKNSANSGDTGGNVRGDEQTAGIYGPGANRGVGAKVTAESDKAVLSSAGADAKLGSKVEAKPEGVEIKAPGAELGLGTWFEINQQQAYFFAPGGKQGLGSTIFLDAENIALFAPGGKDNAGSSIKMDTEAIKVSAPGGENGSSLVLEADAAQLLSPGGSRGGGTKIKLAADKASLIYPGIGGGSITLSRNKIKLNMSDSRSAIELSSRGIKLKSAGAKIKVSSSKIELGVGGSNIKIRPGVITVNGVPLRSGGQAF